MSDPKFPPGQGKMPDLNALMKQAQKLQGDVAKVQEELAKMECDGAAGGGLVTATVNGQFEVVRVKIDKTVVDPNDVGMLEDLVTAAVNAAVGKIRDTSKEKMSSIMGGLGGMPGMPGLF
ncbi:MAG: YbaB/EbfC family nucleoid-associated protein [Kofleriaceae bacterium]